MKGLADVRRFLEENHRFLVFGAGSGGRAVAEWLVARGREVTGFVDNDPSKQESVLDGLPVWAPDAVANGKTPIVIGSLWTAEIARGLSERYGMRPFTDYLPLYNVVLLDVPQFGDWLGVEFERHYLHHRSRFAAAERIFSDEGSRETFRRLIAFRINALRPDALAPEQLPCSPRRWSELSAGTGAWLERLPMAIDEGVRRAAAELLAVGQYQYGERVCAVGSRLIVDGGAYVGDSALMFAALAPKARILAFEPAPRQFEWLCALATRVLAVEPVRAGLWCGQGELSFDLDSGDPSAVHAGDGTPLPVVSLDRYLCDRPELPPVDFVKLDVEGAELEALEGMRETLARDRPGLAVSVYHRAAHLWQIPLWLHENFPGYRLYLQHRNVSPLETVCFAHWGEGE